MNKKKMWERLTAVEQSTKSAHHRIDTFGQVDRKAFTFIATETKGNA